MKSRKVLSGLGILIRVLLIALLAGLLCVLLAVVLPWMVGRADLKNRLHGDITGTETVFTASAKEISNPNRGFYHMDGVLIEDEPQNFAHAVSSNLAMTDTSLIMFEINLSRFGDRELSQQALDNIENALNCLEKLGRQWIIRVVYDWDGNNELYEPDSIEIVLRHMEQVGPLLNKHKDSVFTLQGVFVGNWGEMNGSRYLGDEDVRMLAEKLASVTDPSMYLAVRMPAFWRIITGLGGIEEANPAADSLPYRLGLFNDGMLGNETDWGTYGDHTREQDGDFTYWSREEELTFQDTLCRYVPIGGEVINKNEVNDLANAMTDMNRMHVTYINREYDEEVLNKWKNSYLNGIGIWNGMDGLTYIERHLGYRLELVGTSYEYNRRSDSLQINIGVRNEGMAPLYRDETVNVTLVNRETGTATVVTPNGDLRRLVGGTEKNSVLTMKATVDMRGFPAGTQDVYFRVSDPQTKRDLVFANEEEPDTYGYYIGSIHIEDKPEYTDSEYIDWGGQLVVTYLDDLMKGRFGSE